MKRPHKSGSRSRFDLQRDPHEMHSVYSDPSYAALTAELTDLLRELQAAVGDRPCLPG